MPMGVSHLAPPGIPPPKESGPRHYSASPGAGRQPREFRTRAGAARTDGESISIGRTIAIPG